MTRCPRCGQESPNQARFCRNCGNQLSSNGDTPNLVAPAQSPEQRAQRLLEEAFRLSEQGRVLAAIQTCQQVVAINPNSTSAHSLLGTLYERQGDREKAIRAYEQVLSLSPDSNVERRRLNELMGVPTAREGVTVSPRTARLVLTGSALLVVIIVGITMVLTGSGRGPDRTAPGAVGTAPKQQTQVQVQPELVNEPTVPMPGRTYLGQPSFTYLTTPAQRGGGRTGGWGTATPAPAAQQAQNYGYSATGAERYYAASRQPAALPPVVGAVPYTGRATPVVSTPGWSPSEVVTSSPQTGRSYYLQGDYQRAADTYQTYIEQHPSAGGATREELAWVYMEMGSRGQALQHYRDAANSYQSDLERGHNAEAAKHGLRTCESAIRALQAQ